MKIIHSIKHDVIHKDKIINIEEKKEEVVHYIPKSVTSKKRKRDTDSSEKIYSNKK